MKKTGKTLTLSGQMPKRQFGMEMFRNPHTILEYSNVLDINRAWKDDNTWFGEYVGNYVAATLGGATNEAAHAAGRAAAESGRFEPGSAGFKQAFKESVNDPDLSTGSKFQDASKYYHVDGNYNFSHTHPGGPRHNRPGAASAW